MDEQGGALGTRAEGGGNRGARRDENLISILHCFPLPQRAHPPLGASVCLFRRTRAPSAMKEMICGAMGTVRDYWTQLDLESPSFVLSLLIIVVFFVGELNMMDAEKAGKRP